MPIYPGDYVCGDTEYLKRPLCYNPNRLYAAGPGCGWTTSGGSWVFNNGYVVTATPGSLTDNAATPIPWRDYVPSFPPPPGVFNGLTVGCYFSSASPFACSVAHDGLTAAFDTSTRTLSFGGKTKTVGVPPCGSTTVELKLSFTRNQRGDDVAVAHALFGDYCGDCYCSFACIGVLRAAPPAGKKFIYAVDACSAAATIRPQQNSLSCTGLTCYSCGNLCDTGYTIAPPTSVTISGISGLVYNSLCRCDVLNRTYTDFTTWTPGGAVTPCPPWESIAAGVDTCDDSAYYGTTGIQAPRCYVTLSASQLSVSVLNTSGQMPGVNFVRPLTNFKCYDLSALSGDVPYVPPTPPIYFPQCGGTPTCTILF